MKVILQKDTKCNFLNQPLFVDHHYVGNLWFVLFNDNKKEIFCQKFIFFYFQILGWFLELRHKAIANFILSFSLKKSFPINQGDKIKITMNKVVQSFATHIEIKNPLISAFSIE